MMSLRDLIEASFFVRSTSVDDADAPLFLVKSELKKREKTKDYSVISDGGPFDECCKIATKLTIIASQDKGYHHIKPERRLASQGANEKLKAR